MSVFYTPDDGRMTPETCKVCINKICILLHHVGVLFNLTLDSIKAGKYVQNIAVQKISVRENDFLSLKNPAYLFNVLEIFSAVSAVFTMCKYLGFSNDNLMYLSCKTPRRLAAHKTLATFCATLHRLTDRNYVFRSPEFLDTDLLEFLLHCRFI